MDSKGRATRVIDCAFVERLWRSVKDEHVYLYPHKDGVGLFQDLENTSINTISKGDIRRLMIIQYTVM